MVRLRIKYKKVGAIRFASHRDLLRGFRRAFAAGEVPVCYSQGFNPHPRLSFGPSLRTGWEGLDEYLDVMLEHPISDLDSRCNAKLSEGLEILACARVEKSVPKLSADIQAARYEVAVDEGSLIDGCNPQWDNFIQTASGVGETVEGWRSLISALESDIRVHYQREDVENSEECEGGEPSLLEIEVSRDGGSLRIAYLCTMWQGKGLFPEFLERYIADSQELETPVRVVRTGLYVKRGGVYHSPISEGVVQNSL